MREVRAGRGLTAETLDLVESLQINQDELFRLWQRAYVSGGKAASRVFSDVVSFDSRNPRVLEYVSTVGANRVNEISDSTRRALREMIREGIESGLRPGQVAEEIQRSMGLTLQQTRMVRQMRERLLAEGVPSSRANRQAFQYSQQLLRQRAETIAETEMTMALEMGKREYWLEAMDAGLIKPDEYGLVWIVENDDRVDHLCEVMGDQEANIDGFFDSPIGPVLGPPLHPRCRCAVVMGSKKRAQNFAGEGDSRRSQGQTTNRFTNFITGGVMGKTETGDIYEEVLFGTPSGKSLVEGVYQGRLVKVSNLPGQARNTAIDLRIFTDDFFPTSNPRNVGVSATREYSVEVKTMHAQSKNLKTAIKREEYVRKLADAIDTDDAYAIADRVSAANLRGLPKPEQKRIIDLAFDDIRSLRGRVGVQREPLIIAQVVDDTRVGELGYATVKVYSFEGDFPSKALSQFNEIGEYRVTPDEIVRAINASGHGGDKAVARGLTQLFDDLEDLIDPSAWHPLNTIDNLPNSAVAYVLDAEDAGYTLANRLWYHGSRNDFIVDPDALSGIRRNTNDFNSLLGVHLTTDREVAVRFSGADIGFTGGNVWQSRVEMRNPKVYGLTNTWDWDPDVPWQMRRPRLRQRADWIDIEGTYHAETMLDFDVFFHGVRTGLITKSDFADTVYGLTDDIAYATRTELLAEGFTRPGYLRDSKWDWAIALMDQGVAPDEAFGRVLVDTWNYGGDSPIRALDREIPRHLRTMFPPKRVALVESFREDLMEQGFDGIAYWNRIETSPTNPAGNWSVIVFDPWQVKAPAPWEMDQVTFTRTVMPGIRKESLPGTTIAEADPHFGIIRVDPDKFFRLSLDERRWVLMHEVGHSLETYVMGNTRMRLLWESMETEWLKPGDGKGEQLAEAYARLWVAPHQLERQNPLVYRFLVDLANRVEFPLPGRLVKMLMALLKRFPKHWCNTPLPTVFDAWGEEIENGEWYMEVRENGVTLVSYIVDQWERPKVES